MDEKIIQDWIIKWINNHQSNEIIDKKVDLSAAAIVDSFKIFILINEIEKRFKIKFNDDDFKQKNFRSIDGLVKIINKKIQ